MFILCSLMDLIHDRYMDAVCDHSDYDDVYDTGYGVRVI